MSIAPIKVDLSSRYIGVSTLNVGGVDWCVASEDTDDGPSVFAVTLGGQWFAVDDVLSEGLIDRLQSEMDAPDDDCDGPEDFDADHAANLACIGYERELDSRASQ